MADRINISSNTSWEASVGYSRAVRIGNIVEVSGTTAVLNGEVIGKGSPYEQTKFIFQIIENALKNAGASLKDVVRTRTFVTDISSWEEIGRAHAEYFKDILPCATMVEVKSLINPELLVEIEVSAIMQN
jgi:enamine deaminase RidA (YjgF/YER057c/UK114 family)